MARRRIAFQLDEEQIDTLRQKAAELPHLGTEAPPEERQPTASTVVRALIAWAERTKSWDQVLRTGA